MSPKAIACVLMAQFVSLFLYGLSTADESDLVWSTFLGAGSSEIAYDVALDQSGNVYLVGYTSSASFPATSGAYDESHNGGQDAFVAKFNPTGDTLSYATFLGGSGSDVANDIAVDGSGNAYLTGESASANFPTVGALDDALGGPQDAFVVKLDATGSILSYATYLGGGSVDKGHSLALDADGNAYVIGETWSTDFPATIGAYDTTHNGGLFDAFVAKLNATGSELLYGSFLGGELFDTGHGIAVDADGNAFLTGETQSTNFPTSSGSFDSSHNGDSDAFVAKLNPSGSDLVYSAFLGGTGSDYGRDIALNQAGYAYVTGETYSDDFPATPGAFDETRHALADIFVAKVDSTGGILVYATFMGGSSDDFGYGIVVDAEDYACIVGYSSSAAFPTTDGAYDTTHNGGQDAIVAKLNPSGSDLTYATYLGGSNADKAHGIAVDTSGMAYLCGETESAAFPATIGCYDGTHNGGRDIFVAKLDVSEDVLTSVYGRVGSAPHPPAGTVTFIAYLQRGDQDSVILTEDNWNSHQGLDQGYGGDSLFFTVSTQNFIHPTVVEDDTLIILFTGIASQEGNSGSLKGAVNLSLDWQDFGNATWGASSNPSVPTNLQVANVSPGVVDLSWNASKSLNGDISYRLYRSSLPSGAGNGASDGRYTRIAQGISGTTHRDWDAPQTMCWYIVVAADSVGPNSVKLSGHTDEVAIDAALPVQLSSFSARGADGMVTLEWTTESEWNNQGFHITRCDELDGDFERITTQLIPGAGNSAEPRYYSWQDVRVENDRTYWYQLESVDFQGAIDRYGPVEATPMGSLPMGHQLHQNYPNPFNAQTCIDYQLPEPCQVTVTIYNAAGQQVRSLVDGPQVAGSHRAVWDGRDPVGAPVASGIYFCRLECERFAEAIKMVLLR